MHVTPNHLKDISASLPSASLKLVKTIEDAGFEAYFVGGFVRDALMGKQSQDIDIATSAHWKDIKRIAEASGFKTYETGIKHGTLTVIDADDTTKMEVTTYRVDGTYADSRHPDSVSFVSNIQEDLARRDFTINAIAYNPETGILDPYHGIDDIENEIIRCVGEPKVRFKEDALRILRGVRFSSQLGFVIEPLTFQGMLCNKCLLRKVSTERVTHELDCFLLGSHVRNALLKCIDILSFVLPELVAMKDCEQRTPYHIYDVLEHTAYVVENTPAERTIRWAALCHDMGKPAAAFFDEDGVEHFYGHASVSVEIARGMLKRLLMSNSFIEDVIQLVRVHDDVIAPDDRSVRRVLRRLDGNVDAFRQLCKLKAADASGQAPMCSERIQLAHDLEQILDEVLEAEEVFSLKDLAINGKDLIDAGFAQGPELGSVLNSLLDAVIEEGIPNDKDSLLKAASDILNSKAERS